MRNLDELLHEVSQKIKWYFLGKLMRARILTMHGNERWRIGYRMPPYLFVFVLYLYKGEVESLEIWLGSFSYIRSEHLAGGASEWWSYKRLWVEL